MEPFGASVPSLIWTCCWASAGEARASSAAARRVFFTSGLSWFRRRGRRGGPAGRRARRWAMMLASRYSGAPSTSKASDPAQLRLEGGPVLLLDEHGLGPGQLGPSLLPPESASARSRCWRATTGPPPSATLRPPS